MSKSVCPLRFKEFGRPEHQLCIQRRCAWWRGNACAVAKMADRGGRNGEEGKAR